VTLEIKNLKQFAGIDRKYSKCRVEYYDEHTEYFYKSGNYFLIYKQVSQGKYQYTQKAILLKSMLE
jgi:hypothetical protein